MGHRQTCSFCCLTLSCTGFYPRHCGCFAVNIHFGIAGTQHRVCTSAGMGHPTLACPLSVQNAQVTGGALGPAVHVESPLPWSLTCAVRLFSWSPEHCPLWLGVCLSRLCLCSVAVGHSLQSFVPVGLQRVPVWPAVCPVMRFGCAGPLVGRPLCPQRLPSL